MMSHLLLLNSRRKGIGIIPATVAESIFYQNFNPLPPVDVAAAIFPFDQSDTTYCSSFK
jgi:hypothetical protein